MNRKRHVFKKGHWRIVRIKTQAVEPSGGWVGVLDYQARLDAEYDLDAADPIYRFNSKTDVVRADTSDSDPLHNLVWGRPFKGNDVAGRYVAGRVWYVAHDTNLDRHFLYDRTAKFPVTYRTLNLARRLGVTFLEEAVREEYAEKEYMEVLDFVAWTAFNQGVGRPRVHKKFKPGTKEKAFRRTRYGVKRREVTPWERAALAKLTRGRSKFSFLNRKFTSVAQFNKALARLSPSRRKEVRRYFSMLVEDMEKQLSKLRRKK